MTGNHNKVHGNSEKERNGRSWDGRQQAPIGRKGAGGGAGGWGGGGGGVGGIIKVAGVDLEGAGTGALELELERGRLQVQRVPGRAEEEEEQERVQRRRKSGKTRGRVDVRCLGKASSLFMRLEVFL